MKTLSAILRIVLRELILLHLQAVLLYELIAFEALDKASSHKSGNGNVHHNGVGHFQQE